MVCIVEYLLFSRLRPTPFILTIQDMSNTMSLWNIVAPGVDPSTDFGAANSSCGACIGFLYDVWVRVVLTFYLAAIEHFA